MVVLPRVYHCIVVAGVGASISHYEYTYCFSARSRRPRIESTNISSHQQLLLPQSLRPSGTCLVPVRLHLTPLQSERATIHIEEVCIAAQCRAPAAGHGSSCLGFAASALHILLA